MRAVEEKLAAAVEEARLLGIGADELARMLELLSKEA